MIPDVVSTSPEALQNSMISRYDLGGFLVGFLGEGTCCAGH